MCVVYPGDVPARIPPRGKDPGRRRDGDRFVDLCELPLLCEFVRFEIRGGSRDDRRAFTLEDGDIAGQSRGEDLATLGREIELSFRRPRFSFSDLNLPMLQVD